MKRILAALALLASPALAQQVDVRSLLVAGLPATCKAARIYNVRDGNSATDCSVGLSTNAVWCQCDAGGASYTGISVAAGGGDVVGPSSATDEAVARFDTTTGQLIQNSVVTISDAGAISGGSLAFSDITAGTSAAALVVGTGGTLVTGDGGRIAASETEKIVRKASPGTITACQVVYLKDYNMGTNFYEVELADADGAGTMPAVGIANESITNTVEGKVTVGGHMPVTCDTSSFSIGDHLYVSTTAGAFSTRPSGSSAKVQNLGIVARSHASLGEMTIATILRSNDVPNLDSATFFLGSSGNLAVPVTMSGDTTMDNAGAVTIGADKILESMLKAVNTPTDEFALTYESTTGDFEWQAVTSDLVDDTTPQLGGQLDVNGNAIGDGTLELLAFVETASAINEVTVTNAAIGGSPTLTATGDDTDIDLLLAGKGTGAARVDTADCIDQGRDGNCEVFVSANQVFWDPDSDGAAEAWIDDVGKLYLRSGVTGSPSLRGANDVDSGFNIRGGDVVDMMAGAVVGAKVTEVGTIVTFSTFGKSGQEVLIATGSGGTDVNEVSITSAITTAGPTISATGDDTDIPLNIGGKGTGALNSSSQLRLPTGAWDSTFTTLAWPGTTGNTWDNGIWEVDASTLSLAIGGTARWDWINDEFRAENANGPSIFNSTPSATAPTLFPNRSDSDTGIGHAAADQLSLISGAVEGIRVSEAAGQIDTTLNGRVAGPNQAATLGVAATTVTITSNFLTLTGDGGANTLATITGASVGHVLRVLFVDALVTITDDDTHAADSVDLNAAFTSADDTVLALLYDGTSWYETSRSVN